VKRHNSWPAGTKVLEVNLGLPKGRVVRGRVVEADSGRPVGGASVVYRPGPRNPRHDEDCDFDSPVLTNVDGEFALTALPGTGLLAVEAPSPDFIRVPLTGRKLGRSRFAHPRGFTWLDIPSGADRPIPEPRITLRKGVRVEARLLAPDGSPLDLVMGWCAALCASQLENWVPPRAFPDGRFRLEGANPHRTYRALFVHPGRRLGAVAELKDDSRGPVEIRLQPAATAKGTVVDGQGRPAAGLQILPWIALTALDRELRAKDFDDNRNAASYHLFTMQPLLPSYRAEFNYDNLIPGVRYYISAGGTYHVVPALKPGEVRDLGKIVVKPQPLE
jgi:hypothetical protein